MYVAPLSLPTAVGTPFQSTCVVIEQVRGLTQQPSATWVYHSNREPVVNSSALMITTSRNSTTATSVMMFPAILQSQSVRYICVGSIMSLGVNTSLDSVYSFNAIPCKLIIAAFQSNHICHCISKMLTCACDMCAEGAVLLGETD